MLKSIDNSFGELAQYTVSCIDELTQNLGIYDNGPTFDRLCQGHFASQLSEVNPFLGDTGIHLAGYDQSISLMEEALLKLKSAWAGLKRSMNVALSLCTPIRRLPKDILVKTFVIYTEESWPNRWLFLGKRHDYFVTLTSEDWGSGTYPCIRGPNSKISQICSVRYSRCYSRILLSGPPYLFS
ncbi:hypothetical protein GYMLUDRAFT_244212 [Collybiopsis luxurians FD-317 M1]|uniref:Uncharacterized protein n=1 Tax=Collybiopsis luxurians FD-317 M1 TaxID=944289 RepID=A0A0D0CDT9_9AGAR|nr:hypothetical protein GYMLUDRAFT_244212 [Collybiopsis luxurians FD-317 M1]